MVFAKSRVSQQLDSALLEVGAARDNLSHVRAGIDAENASHAAHHFGALPFGQKKTEALGFRF